MKVLIPNSDEEGQQVRLSVLGRSFPLDAGVAELGAIAPTLSASFWVDSGYTGSVSNGSILAPYKSLQAAHDAAVGAGLGAVTLLAVKTSASETLTTSITTAVMGMSDGALPTTNPVTFGAVTAGATIALNDLVCSSITATAGSVNCYYCSVTGNISAAGLNVNLTRTLYTGTITCGTLTLAQGLCQNNVTLALSGSLKFTDRFAEPDLFSSTGLAGAGGITTVISNDLPKASTQTDANASSPFDAKVRFIYPGALLTANRTLTLQNTGTAVRKSAMVDVYTQGFTLQFIDQQTGATITTYPASGAAYRYQFTYDGVNTWSFNSRVKLGS